MNDNFILAHGNKLKFGGYCARFSWFGNKVESISSSFEPSVSAALVVVWEESQFVANKENILLFLLKFSQQ